MTVLLVLALWMAVGCLAALLFSALVRGAGRASECVEVDPFPPAGVPAPRASAEEQQPSRVQSR